jgi:phosphoglycolate phosphatase-like HAD superfamily hydrolase
MLRLITDFDGPVMDVSERYYRVYCSCLEKTQLPHQPVQQLTKAEFWELKRAKVAERQIGLLSGLEAAQAEEFTQLRRQTVHQLSYMIYDCPVPGAISTLEKIQNRGIDLAVMTMRRTRELEAAFAQYDLWRFFPPERRYCLSDDYVKTADVKDKPRLMERALRELPPAPEIWMVGDTEADIIAAKTHGIPVIGVLSGIRNREQLERYEPNFIADTLDEALNLIAPALAPSG